LIIETASGFWINKQGIKRVRKTAVLILVFLIGHWKIFLAAKVMAGNENTPNFRPMQGLYR
jgi:hypothetical protein